MLKKDLQKEFELLQEKYDKLKSDYVGTINDFAEKEKERITEFADILGLYSNDYNYGTYSKKYTAKTWGAIFFEIGKLKSFQEGIIEQRDYERSLTNDKRELSELRKQKRGFRNEIKGYRK